MPSFESTRLEHVQPMVLSPSGRPPNLTNLSTIAFELHRSQPLLRKHQEAEGFEMGAYPGSWEINVHKGVLISSMLA